MKRGLYQGIFAPLILKVKQNNVRMVETQTLTTITF